MMTDGAVISECGHYRYWLERWLGPALSFSPPVVFAMCNPSTADAVNDDATIRKCKGFTSRLGFSRMVVVNLFAYRSRYPKDLLKTQDPHGPDNRRWVSHACADSGAVIIAAWGNCVPRALRWTIPGFVRELQGIADRRVLCLGTTDENMPRHPVMLGYNTPLVEYRP